MTSHRFARAVTFVVLLSSFSCRVGVDSDEVANNYLDTSTLGESCTRQIMTVEPQGDETRFGINDQGPVALAPVIPAQRICDRINEAKDRLTAQGGKAFDQAQQCVARCRDAQEVTKQSPVRGFKGFDPEKLKAMGEVADAFNAALGNKTNFAGEDGEDAAAAAEAAKEAAAEKAKEAAAKAKEAADKADAADDKNEKDEQVAVDCEAPVLQVIVTGDTDRAEQRFGTDDVQVALNPNIPIENICQNRVADACKDRCRAAQAEVVASGVRGQSGALNEDNLRKMGEQADNFNRALGNDTDFADNPIFQDFTDLDANVDDKGADDKAADDKGADDKAADDKAADDKAADDKSADDKGAANVDDDEVACEAPVLEVIVSGTATAAEQRFGVDGVQVALNPNIPIENICQNRVADACKDRCRAAQAEVVASGVRGQSGALNEDNLRKMGEQADNFNRALGNTSNFAADPIFKNFKP